VPVRRGGERLMLRLAPPEAGNLRAVPSGPADVLRTAPPGARVVSRYRITGGFTDALGYLRSCNDSACVVDTRRGEVTVPLSDVVAAKQVPEPPPRRSAGSH